VKKLIKMHRRCLASLENVKIMAERLFSVLVIQEEMVKNFKRWLLLAKINVEFISDCHQTRT